ncbi:MAG: hypothetical protein ACFE0P_14330 [Oceanicaulis sp.]
MYDYNLTTVGASEEAARTDTLRRVFARRGFRPTDDLAEIASAFALGESALGGRLASAETALACEQKTRRCFFVRSGEDGEIDGFIALLYLNAEGFTALMYGRFTPADPDLAHLTGPDDPAAAIYVWCLAGSSAPAQRAVVRAVTEARRKAFPHLALFARPVSREGRMMTAALDAPGAGQAFLGWVPAPTG